jgi:hypothetical protein
VEERPAELVALWNRIAGAGDRPAGRPPAVPTPSVVPCRGGDGAQLLGGDPCPPLKAGRPRSSLAGRCVGGPPSDDTLISLACRNANFRALWAGDLSGVDGDHSRGDFHLVRQLLYWTDRDTARTDRLFRQSALMRAKWDEKRGEITYSDLTIANALPLVTESRGEYRERRAREAAAKQPEEKPRSCPTPFLKLAVHKESGDAHRIPAPCNNLDCPVCRESKRAEESERGRARLASDEVLESSGQVHYATFRPDQKSAVQAKLSRLRKQGYSALHVSVGTAAGEVAMLVTAPLEGAVPLSEAEALARWGEMMAAAVPVKAGKKSKRARLVWWSRGWPKESPPPKREAQYQIEGDWLRSEEGSREVAKRYGLDVYDGPGGRMVIRLPWNHSRRREVLDALQESDGASVLTEGHCSPSANTDARPSPTVQEPLREAELFDWGASPYH